MLCEVLCAVWSPFDFQRTLIILLILYFWTVLHVKNSVADVFSINLRFRISIQVQLQF